MLYPPVDLKNRILSRRILNTKTLTTYMKNLVRLLVLPYSCYCCLYYIDAVQPNNDGQAVGASFVSKVGLGKPTENP